MTNDINKDQITTKIKVIEEQIQQAKANLKSWASQISKYHKSLKEITSQLESIKTKINNHESI